MISLYESILSSTNSGIQKIIKDNLKTCYNITEFSKMWSALGLDIKGFHWGKYAGSGSYTYITNKNNKPRFLIYCSKDKIIIYNDDKDVWKDDEDFYNYSEKVADILKMNMKINKLKNGEQYILTFK